VDEAGSRFVAEEGAAEVAEFQQRPALPLSGVGRARNRHLEQRESFCACQSQGFDSRFTGILWSRFLCH
jgi:hypothetical protein